jgi:hypothetical protein
MVCIGTPVFVGLAVFGFWGGNKIRNHGRYVLERGTIPAKSWFLGFPRTDVTVELTERVKKQARLFVYVSYIWFAFGLLTLLSAIGFFIYAFITVFQP